MQNTNSDTNNQLIAQSAQGFINKRVTDLKSLIKAAPGILADGAAALEGISNMTDEQAKKALEKSFNDCAKSAKATADRFRSIPATARQADTFEKFCATLSDMAKEVKEADTFKGKFLKVAKIVGVFFWKVASSLLQNLKKAAMWVLVTGIQVLCVVGGFIIRCITAAARSAKRLFGMTRALTADNTVTLSQNEYKIEDIMVTA